MGGSHASKRPKRPAVGDGEAAAAHESGGDRTDTRAAAGVGPGVRLHLAGDCEGARPAAAVDEPARGETPGRRQDVRAGDDYRAAQLGGSLGSVSRMGKKGKDRT